MLRREVLALVLTLVEYDSALLLLSLMLIGGFGFGSYFL
jgi:hypothetical protein